MDDRHGAGNVPVVRSIDKSCYGTRITFIPPRLSISPVTPSLSQEGLPLFKYARRAPTMFAISNVYLAPLTWNLVTSCPVSGAMIRNLPSRTAAPLPSSFSPVLGVDIPPSCSGQTGTRTYFLFKRSISLSRFFGLCPCQRQGIPSKQALMRTGSKSVVQSNKL
jgi:hypothetical protein